jgi:hypothetical protein
MTTNLPKGFVTNSESITGDIERIDTVDVEEISQLWKGMFPIQSASLLKLTNIS